MIGPRRGVSARASRRWSDDWGNVRVHGKHRKGHSHVTLAVITADLALAGGAVVLGAFTMSAQPEPTGPAPAQGAPAPTSPDRASGPWPGVPGREGPLVRSSTTPASRPDDRSAPLAAEAIHLRSPAVSRSREDSTPQSPSSEVGVAARPGSDSSRPGSGPTPLGPFRLTFGTSPVVSAGEGRRPTWTGPSLAAGGPEPGAASAADPAVQDRLVATANASVAAVDDPAVERAPIEVDDNEKSPALHTSDPATLPHSPGLQAAAPTTVRPGRSRTPGHGSPRTTTLAPTIHSEDRNSAPENA